MQSDFADAAQLVSHDTFALTRSLSLAVAIALVVDGGLIALCATLVQAANPETPLSPVTRQRLLFGAIALALTVAVMIQWQCASQP